MQWRHTRAYPAPWIPLFQVLGQPPMYPRRAWMRQVRRALARRRERRKEISERTKLLDREPEAEAGEEREQQIPAYQQAALPQALPPETRRAALFAVFDEMAEHQEEFLQDGRPRVESVNDRLSARGQQVSATRKEIDEAFEAWKQGRASELFAVFDEMAEHQEEFLQDGRPRVESVNDRLSARGQQVSAARKEIDEAFEAWKQGRASELFAVFDEMAEHQEEFLQDGRPRVESVNDRLSARGQQVSATRKEIDEAFETWKQGRASESP